jgi:hypothetical protein
VVYLVLTRKGLQDVLAHISSHRIKLKLWIDTGVCNTDTLVHLRAHGHEIMVCPKTDFVGREKLINTLAVIKEEYPGECVWVEYWSGVDPILD